MNDKFGISNFHSNRNHDNLTNSPKIIFKSLLNMDKINLGIEIGAKKSCLGYEYTDEICIIPNFISEKIEPSIVSIINDEEISGERLI